MFQVRMFFRDVDIVALFDHHAVCSLAYEAISDESREVLDVPHSQLDSAVHISDSRSDGHSHHEDSLAL